MPARFGAGGRATPGGGAGGGLITRVPADRFVGADLAACRLARDAFFNLPANADALGDFQANAFLAIILDPADSPTNVWQTYEAGQAGRAYDATQWLPRGTVVPGDEGPAGPRGTSVQWIFRNAIAAPNAVAAGVAAANGALVAAPALWTIAPVPAPAGERTFAQQILVTGDADVAYGAVGAWSGQDGRPGAPGGRGLRGTSEQYIFRNAAAPPAAAAAGVVAANGVLAAAPAGWALNPSAAPAGQRTYAQRIRVTSEDQIAYGAVAPWSGERGEPGADGRPGAKGDAGGVVNVAVQALANQAAPSAYTAAAGHVLTPNAGDAQVVRAGASTFAMAADGSITFAAAGSYLIKVKGDLAATLPTGQDRMTLIAELVRGAAIVEHSDSFYIRDGGDYFVIERLLVTVAAAELAGWTLRLRDLSRGDRVGATGQFRGRLANNVRGNPELEIAQLASAAQRTAGGNVPAPSHALYVGWSEDVNFTDAELGEADGDHSLAIPAAPPEAATSLLYLGIWRSDADGGDPDSVVIAGSANLRNTFTAAVARARGAVAGQFIRSITTQNAALLAGETLTVS